MYTPLSYFFKIVALDGRQLAILAVAAFCFYLLCRVFLEKEDSFFLLLDREKDKSNFPLFDAEKGVDSPVTVVYIHRPTGELLLLSPVLYDPR